MATELSMLAWAMLLGLVHIFAASTAMTRERGTRWNASARDGEARPLGVLAGRLARAQANFLETFPFFAAAVLAVLLAGRGSATTALAAQVYLAARVVYLPLYALGVPYLRSLVWLLSLASIVVLLAALL